jgi:hypothetical protein
LRVPQYADNRLTDGGKVVSLTRRPPFTPQEGSWYSFLLEAESTIFVHKKIISAVKRVEFVSDRMSYIILRRRRCDIIVLNVHTPTEDKIDDVKDRC